MVGFVWYINSRVSRLRQQEDRNLKPDSLILTSQVHARSLTLEDGGLDRGAPVPSCSLTLVCRIQEVDPTYSRAHLAQLILKTRGNRNKVGSL